MLKKFYSRIAQPDGFWHPVGVIPDNAIIGVLVAGYWFGGSDFCRLAGCCDFWGCGGGLRGGD